MSVIAERRLKQFQQKIGEAMVKFATHAALPVVLNSELVHLLRINFFYSDTSINYLTEAEFLLSSFCREIGEDLYEIEPAMRTVLLQKLYQQHPKQIKEIAALLWQYTKRYTPWRTREGLQNAQLLTALNFLDAQKASEWFQEVEALEKAVSQEDREWFVAMKKQVSVDMSIQTSSQPVKYRMEIVIGDITEQNVDAIVNATDTYFSGGGSDSGSVDYAIHRTAGYELMEECKQLDGCAIGEAKMTKGYNLPARFVIHTVGPVWYGGDSDEAEKLAQSYRSCLKLAEQHNIKTIAFPAISIGTFGFPIKLASKIAVREVSRFLMKNTSIEKVIFVLFGEKAYDYYHAELESLQFKTVQFETVTVNERGEEIKRNSHQAQYITEELGNGMTLDMVYIPRGTFLMGSPTTETGYFDKESPQHQVTISSFFIGKYPVTQAQWQTLMGNNPSNFRGENRPVENVSWQDAIAFCNKLSKITGKIYRLPSEAEWEYACRAGTTTPFYFGVTITGDLANYDGNYTYASELKSVYRQETTDVGSFPPNPFGLYDMHGNVWELCADFWHDNYEGAPTNGSVWEIKKDEKIDQKKHFLRRGGSWRSYPNGCRAAFRTWAISNDQRINAGFRIVVGVSE